jgi:predicted transcriptional regulator
MALTPAQLRAARALLGWSRDDLAKQSDTSAETMKNFELRGTDPRQGTVLKWQRALEKAGCRFIDAEDGGDGEGVRFRKRR